MLTTPPPDKASGLTLRAQLREQLREHIMGGVWKTHQKLPSEQDLMDSTGVSRITVRQALADLAGDGLIVRVQGKGSFVAPAPVRQELTRLQGLSEALAYQGKQVQTQVLSLRQARWPAHVAQALGVTQGDPCVELNTVRYADGQALSLNTTWIVAGIGSTLQQAELADTDLLTLYEHRHGLRVARAVVDIRASVCSRQHLAALALKDNAAVLQVDRSVFSADQQPLHHETSIYRADAFTYRVELAR